MHVMKDVDVDNNIKRLLAYVASYIKIDNYQGLSDINVYSEEFSAGILNPVWQCDLKDLNTYTDPNYPGIDLGDKVKKVSVQVTSTSTRDKIAHTIEEFEKNDLHDDYDDLYVFVFGDTRPKYKAFTTNGKYTFSTDNVLSLNELCFIIRGLPIERKTQIATHLNDKLNLPSPTEFKVTVENFLVNKFFKALIDMANEDMDSDTEVEIVDEADLDIKKERFQKYWSFIEECYKKVVTAREELLFRKAFNRLDQSERLKLQAFLQHMSEKSLLQTADPVKAIEIVRKDLFERANIGYLSEVQIENYLFYQLYMCKLLPNPAKQAA